MKRSYSATVVKVGNGIGFKFPNIDDIPYKENDKITVTITDDGKIILENRYERKNVATYASSKAYCSLDRSK